MALSANIHSPLREIATVVTSYRSGSSARNTWAAVTQLTSCSADSPPKMTITWVREREFTRLHGTCLVR